MLAASLICFLFEYCYRLVSGGQEKKTCSLRPVRFPPRSCRSSLAADAGQWPVPAPFPRPIRCLAAGKNRRKFLGETPAGFQGRYRPRLLSLRSPHSSIDAVVPPRSPSYSRRDAATYEAQDATTTSRPP